MLRSRRLRAPAPLECLARSVGPPARRIPDLQPLPAKGGDFTCAVQNGLAALKEFNDEVEAGLRKAVNAGKPGDAGTYQDMHELAILLMRRGGEADRREAEELLISFARGQERLLGKEHPATSRAEKNLQLLRICSSKPSGEQNGSLTADSRTWGSFRSIQSADSFGSLSPVIRRLNGDDCSPASADLSPGAVWNSLSPGLRPPRKRMLSVGDEPFLPVGCEDSLKTIADALEPTECSELSIPRSVFERQITPEDSLKTIADALELTEFSELSLPRSVFERQITPEDPEDALYSLKTIADALERPEFSELSLPRSAFERQLTPEEQTHRLSQALEGCRPRCDSPALASEAVASTHASQSTSLSCRPLPSPLAFSDDAIDGVCDLVIDTPVCFGRRLSPFPDTEPSLRAHH